MLNDSDVLESMLNNSEPNVKSDMLKLIIEYLHEEQLFSTAMVLKDEANAKLASVVSKRCHLPKLKKLINAGDWVGCHQLIKKLIPRDSQRRFSYHLLRQEYFELIHAGEFQRAFAFLTKHLKPLEDIADTHRSHDHKHSHSNGHSEFKELCYLLSCKSVKESDSFRDWIGPLGQREILADTISDSLYAYFQCEVTSLSPSNSSSNSNNTDIVSSPNNNNNDVSDIILASPHRLMTLMQQAYSFQVASRSSLSFIKSIHDNFNSVDSNNKNLPNDIIENKKPVHGGLLVDFKPFSTPSTNIALLVCHGSRVINSQKNHGNSSISLSMASYGSLKCATISSCRNLSSNYLDRNMNVVIGGTDKGNILIWKVNKNKLRTNSDAIDTIINDDLNNSSEIDRENRPTPGLPIISSLKCIRITPTDSKIRSRARYSCQEIHHSEKSSDFHEDYHDKVYAPKIRDVSISPTGLLMAAALSDSNIVLLEINDKSRDNQDNKKKENLFGDKVGSKLKQNSDIDFGAYLGALDVHEGDVNSISFHPDCKNLISGSIDKTVAFHDLSTMTCIKIFQGHTAAVSSVGCNQVGNLIISSSRDGTVKFWDILSGLNVNTITPTTSLSSNSSKSEESSQSNSFGGEITSSTLSSDGRYLLITSRFSVARLVDIRTNKVCSRFTVPSTSTSSTSSFHNSFSTSSNISSFYKGCFCAADSMVATGGPNGSVNIWNSQTGFLDRTLSIRNPASTLSPQASNLSMLNKYPIFSTFCDDYTGTVAAASSSGISLWI